MRYSAHQTLGETNFAMDRTGGGMTSKLQSDVTHLFFVCVCHPVSWPGRASSPLDANKVLKW